MTTSGFSFFCTISPSIKLEVIDDDDAQRETTPARRFRHPPPSLKINGDALNRLCGSEIAILAKLAATLRSPKGRKYRKLIFDKRNYNWIWKKLLLLQSSYLLSLSAPRSRKSSGAMINLPLEYLKRKLCRAREAKGTTGIGIPCVWLR